MKIYDTIKSSFKEIKEEFHSSKNKFYVIEKNKIYLLSSFALIGFLFAFIGYLFEGHHPFLAFTNSLRMFALGFPESYSIGNIFLLFSAILICFVIFSATLFTFFQDFIDKFIAKKIIEKNHIVVFGLGEINRAFLNSEFDDEMAVIIESNKDNKYISEYQSKGFGVIIGDVLSSNQLSLLNYETMNHAIIALGNDRVNIELALKIIETIEKKQPKTPTKLTIHINNPELKEIFHQKFIIEESELKIDIKTFSFNEECSKNLFDKYSFVKYEDIISNNRIKSVVLGEGSLALEIIKELMILSNLPNKNIHEIYLITENVYEFFEKVSLTTHYEKIKFPQIKFNVIKTEYKKQEFFQQEIFKDKFLNNIYICNEDEEKNLSLAVELYEKVYIRDLFSGVKIYFAMFNEYSLSKKINEDNKTFQRFFTFGNLNEIFTKRNLLDEDNYILAKMIHTNYEDEFNLDSFKPEEKLNEKWFKIEKYSDKLSNIAQSKSIDLKLMYLGLKKIRNKNEDGKILLERNQKIFQRKIYPLLEEADLDYEKIKKCSIERIKSYDEKNDYDILYFPQNFENEFEKLLEMEHERWNSFHYINGWEYHNKDKEKDIKLHNCLKPLKEFTEKKLQITIIYDIYSIVYIPNYLAYVGYEIKEL